MKLDICEKIKQLFQMGPLPIEGGYFAQTYLSPERIAQCGLPARYPTDKPLGTAIIYLLTTEADCFSEMHRLPTDEVYHFYMGDPVEMLLLYPDGHSEHVILGHDIFNGQKIQFVVPKGVWQGSHLKAGSQYALLGTTMAPGYEDDDYERAARQSLTAQYPNETALIAQLTRQ